MAPARNIRRNNFPISYRGFLGASSGHIRLNAASATGAASADERRRRLKKRNDVTHQF